MKSPTYSAADAVRGRGMGVAIDCPPKCKMCEASEHAVALKQEELTKAHGSVHLAVEDRAIAIALMREAEANERKMRHQRNLALFALGMVALLGMAGRL